jgi:hypothetical protein
MGAETRRGRSRRKRVAMDLLRPTLAVTLAASLLASPAAGAATSRAEQRALAQERAYMQQAPSGRDMTPVERALAQERTYTQQATVGTTPARSATQLDDGMPVALLAGGTATALLLVAIAGMTARRRQILAPGIGHR